MTDFDKLHQVGAIIWGKTLNAREWIEQAKRDGYIVRIMDGWAELYRKI